MDIKTYNQAQYETNMMQLHRIRTGLVSFKSIYKAIVKKGFMTLSDFNELNEAAMISTNYNDSILSHNLVLKMGVK
jgi:hypothetical protein